MPNGTLFQTPTGAASIRAPSSFSPTKGSTAQPKSSTTATASSLPNGASPTDGQENVNELTSAIDDFISEVETKFKVVSTEILTKLDDMAERCDRIEAELQLSYTADGIGEGGTSQAEITS